MIDAAEICEIEQVRKIVSDEVGHLGFSLIGIN